MPCQLLVLRQAVDSHARTIHLQSETRDWYNKYDDGAVNALDIPTTWKFAGARSGELHQTNVVPASMSPSRNPAHDVSRRSDSASGSVMSGAGALSVTTGSLSRSSTAGSSIARGRGFAGAAGAMPGVSSPYVDWMGD